MPPSESVRQERRKGDAGRPVGKRTPSPAPPAEQPLQVLSGGDQQRLAYMELPGVFPEIVAPGGIVGDQTIRPPSFEQFESTQGGIELLGTGVAFSEAVGLGVEVHAQLIRPQIVRANHPVVLVAVVGIRVAGGRPIALG